MSHYLKLIVLLLFISISDSLLAEEQVRVVGLFKNSAMVEFGGKQKIYRAGQKLSPTIMLIQANPKAAIFLINGKQVKLGLQKASGFNASLVKDPGTDGNVKKKEAKIYQNTSGMYRTPGFINGFAVNFLVDTGASQIAMNEAVAKRIGLLYKSSAGRVGVSTAAGNVTAWKARLKKVRVGAIELNNIEALVIKGTGPGEVLLGMSFLSKVKMENNGQLMKLTQKY